MRIYSIFSSIDGEVNAHHQGRLTTFIRFAGCNFYENPCSYCDTGYAQHPESGVEMSVGEVMEKVGNLPANKVTITGGEPLYQAEALYNLTKTLYFKNYYVSVETNGSKPIQGHGVGCWIMDYKLPSSGMKSRMMWENFEFLTAKDFVKFVVMDRGDYEKALEVMIEMKGRNCHTGFAFSPVFQVLDPNLLIKWLYEDGVPDVIVNLQLHKFAGLREGR